MKKMICIVITIAVIGLAVSCNHEKRTSANNIPKNDALEDAYRNYLDNSNWETFDALCMHAKRSENIKFKTIYCYSIVSDFMTPGIPSKTRDELIEAEAYLKDHSSSLADSLRAIISNHKKRFARRTSAEIVGDYGNRDCLHVLMSCLELETDKVVVKAIKNAINRIVERHPERTGQDNERQWRAPQKLYRVV